ncbi:MAG: pyruvate ferredoxin oxidoreductase [Deltaproteobacteria bacterium RBG_16_48_10]|nr:MAG: pyruvate ferredoxin oxidoreductase [Deltaproteobacteria bacterium RBG_16_48_10]
MIEVRFHGRGGQGAQVASKILAVAFFHEGFYVQSFPAFGVERRGAPVMAFLRVDRQPIQLRVNIYEPDHIVVLDPTLIGAIDVTSGLKENGWILINSGHSPEAFQHLKDFRIATVDATGIAIRNGLGSRTSPIVNTAILGAFSKVTELLGIDSIALAIREEIPGKKGENVQAARKAYNEVKYEIRSTKSETNTNL